MEEDKDDASKGLSAQFSCSKKLTNAAHCAASPGSTCKQSKSVLEEPAIAATGPCEVSVLHDVMEGCSSGCVSSSDERCAGCAEPNIGNGHDHETYSWTQTLADVSLNVPVPPGTKGRGCDVTITKNRLKVSSRRGGASLVAGSNAGTCMHQCPTDGTVLQRARWASMGSRPF